MLDFSDSMLSIVSIQIWQIGVLGLLVGFVNRFFARRSPHLAYALWLVVLAKCFVPPIGNSPVNLLGLVTPADAWKSWSNTTAPIAPATDSPANDEWESTAAANSKVEESASQALNTPAIEPTTTISPATPLIPSHLIAQIAALVWMSGSVLLCGIAIGRINLVGQRYDALGFRFATS